MPGAEENSPFLTPITPYFLKRVMGIFSEGGGKQVRVARPTPQKGAAVSKLLRF